MYNATRTPTLVRNHTPYSTFRSACLRRGWNASYVSSKQNTIEDQMSYLASTSDINSVQFKILPAAETYRKLLHQTDFFHCDIVHHSEQIEYQSLTVLVQLSIRHHLYKFTLSVLKHLLSHSDRVLIIRTLGL